MVSGDAADSNRMEEARNYGRASLWTSLVGVFLGVVAITIVIVFAVRSMNETNDDLHDTLKSYQDNTEHRWNDYKG